LKRLAQSANRIPAQNLEDGSALARPLDFREWRKRASGMPWKLGWWDSPGEFAATAIQEAKRLYDIEEKEPHDFLNVTKGQLKKHERVLTFKLSSGKDIQWMYVDFVVPVSRSDKYAYEAEYPFQAVQVHRPKYYSTPPFVIDAGFRVAFRHALNIYGQDKVEKLKSLAPPKALLDLIEGSYAP
jgi:hypothetical protein